MAEQIDILNDQLNKTKEKGLCSPKKDEININTEDMAKFRQWYDSEIRQRRDWLNQQIKQTNSIAQNYKLSPAQQRKQRPLSPSQHTIPDVIEESDDRPVEYCDPDHTSSKLSRTDHNENHLAEKWNEEDTEDDSS